MPSISQTIKFRNQRREKINSSPWSRLALGTALLLSLLAGVFCLAVLWFYVALTQDLPSVESLPALLEPPGGTLLQPTRLYDRKFEHVILTLENSSAAGKQYLHVSQVEGITADNFSQSLIEATVVVYDPGFWKHAGYTAAGWTSGTHPTIAQWLIADLVLDEEQPSIQRNLRERILAAQVTATYGREKILEWYLNNAQYGELIYGADAAARVYLGKSASSLNLAEAALLTAISETPHITPSNVSRFLKEKQAQVIQAMLAGGSITEDQAKDAIAEDIQFKDMTTTPSIAPAFTGLVLEQVSKVLPLEKILRGGYTIVTTLDFELQAQAECISRAQAANLEGSLSPKPGDQIQECQVAEMLPVVQPGGDNSSDEIAREVIVIDPQTGQILAMIGNPGTGWIPSMPENHTAGTSIAPLIYLTAFTRGMSPATLLWDIPGSGDTGAMEPIQPPPPASELSTYHGPVRARMALVNDYRAATQDLFTQVGGENVRIAEQRFGISSAGVMDGNEVTLDELFAQQMSLLEIANVYSTLANQGVMAGQPVGEVPSADGTAGLTSTSLLRVIGVDGSIQLDWSIPQNKPIISQQLAFLVTHVLSDEGTREDSLEGNFGEGSVRPTAVKAGFISNGNEDWVVGYTPQIVVGVWIGSIDNAGQIPINIPAELWQAIMQFATDQQPVQDFNLPAGISEVKVCDPSGLLPSVVCPRVVEEVFLTGNEPSQVDNLYQKIVVDRQTGLLATVYTPSELREEKVYLVVPPRALEWAQAAGLSIPPDTYDPIDVSQPGTDEVKITSPRILDNVAGTVSISGSAAGSDFQYYRLQVGQGINPNAWVQIGENHLDPIQDGLLGTWDTMGLEGIFIVQLQVVRQDQRVEQVYLQVTVDNIDPMLEIIAPADGERFTLQQGDTIMIQGDVSDNQEVGRVEFFVDGELVMSLHQPPYVILWSTKPGEHALQVKAYDMAGNVTQRSVTFSVDR